MSENPTNTPPTHLTINGAVPGAYTAALAWHELGAAYGTVLLANAYDNVCRDLMFGHIDYPEAVGHLKFITSEALVLLAMTQGMTVACAPEVTDRG